MPIRVGCPGCKQPVEAPDSSGGQVIACPRCGQKMRVPAAIPIVKPPPPPPPPVPEFVDDAPATPRLSRRGRDDELSPFLDDADLFDPQRRPDGSPIPKHIQLPEDAKGGDLGRPVAEFRSRAAGWLFVGTAGLSVVLGVVLVVLVVMIAMRPGSTGQGGAFLRRGARTGDAVALVVVPLIGLLFSGGFAVHFLRLWARRLVLCEKGFVDCYLLRKEVHYWEQVEKLYQKLVASYVVPAGQPVRRRGGGVPSNAAFAGMSHEYTLELRDGRRLKFSTKDETPDVEKLGWYLHQFVLREHLPAARQALDSAQWVRFDDIAISREGLAVGDDRLAWGQVGRIEPEEGRLVIYQPFSDTAWAEAPIHDVPNYAVFVRLLSVVLAGK